MYRDALVRFDALAHWCAFTIMYILYYTILLHTILYTIFTILYISNCEFLTLILFLLLVRIYQLVVYAVQLICIPAIDSSDNPFPDYRWNIILFIFFCNQMIQLPWYTGLLLFISDNLNLKILLSLLCFIASWSFLAFIFLHNATAPIPWPQIWTHIRWYCTDQIRTRKRQNT